MWEQSEELKVSKLGDISIEIHSKEKREKNNWKREQSFSDLKEDIKSVTRYNWTPKRRESALKKYIGRNNGWNFPHLEKKINLQIHKLRKLLIHAAIRMNPQNTRLDENPRQKGTHDTSLFLRSSITGKAHLWWQKQPRLPVGSGENKRIKELSGMMEMLYILIVMMVIQEYSSIGTHKM